MFGQVTAQQTTETEVDLEAETDAKRNEKMITYSREIRRKTYTQAHNC